MTSFLVNRLHPITQRRLRRFRGMKRAWWSFWLLAAAYGCSLFAEWLCNDKPLYVRFEGRSLFPILRYHSEREILGAGNLTRVDFKDLERTERFRADPRNRMVWPLVPHGPLEIVRPDRIHVPDTVQVRIVPEPQVAAVNVTPELAVTRAIAAGFFFDREDGTEEGLRLEEHWNLPRSVREGIEQRFRNEAAPAVAGWARKGDGREAEVSLPPFVPRATPPRTVRVTFRERVDAQGRGVVWTFLRGNPEWPEGDAIWQSLGDADQQAVRAAVAERFERMVEPRSLSAGAQRYRFEFLREDVRFPFRPVQGHPLGLDAAGRDVLARLLYGLRTSMTFGMLLVVASMVVGTCIGALQGYYGGATDLVGQRLLEIWDALPFLYILILMGSVYGRSFALLLACYAVFNWIGISYYMRAEFLRLRQQSFVEAARALGLPGWQVMFRHMLPNALVPLVTFFPFSLVSAIGTLAALDYLGFGLPPPTASWGEMLAQAQEYRWAWWLTVYPSLSLFAVMLLGVFIGEGVRQAFDPKPYARMQ